MASKLQIYLRDRYEDGNCNIWLASGTGGKTGGASMPIQVDDQDDGDSLTDFCNIFCTVISERNVRVELCGKFPITDAMTALTAGCGGSADRARGRIAINVSTDAPSVIDELARAIKATARMGAVAGNPAWLRVSARTVSSLLRFGRVLRDYHAASSKN